jgi:hypothetical protein
MQRYRDALDAVELCESVRPQHKPRTDELDAWLGVYSYLIHRQIEESCAATWPKEGGCSLLR